MDRPNDNWTPFFRSLGFRIALAVGLMLLTSYVVFIYLIVDIQQTFYFQRVIREAERLSAAMMNATNHSMLRDDATATRSIVTDVAKQEDISAIRIYNHDGITKFANDPGEVGKKVDKQAEACLACHSEDKAFSEVVTTKRTRIHYHGDHRVLGMITPIYNNKSCYQASCHVHSEQQKVLGVLDLGLSLKQFDAHVQALVFDTILLGIVTFCGVLGAIGLYVTMRVHRPITRLRDAARKIALGDFSDKLIVKGSDQIAECAKAFNLMRDQIRRRTQELTRSREEYKGLFEQVPCYICVINRQYEIVRQNSFMRDLFKGATGQHCYEAFKKSSRKCPDCRIDETFENGRTYSKAHCGTTGVGETADYVSYVAPIVDEGKRTVYAMVIAMDVRDKVRLETELQISRDFQTNLIEHSIHGIIATDAHGRVTIYNIAAQNLLGKSPEEALGDQNLEHYFPQEFLEIIISSHAKKNAGAQRLVAQETTIRSSAGEAIPIRFSGVTLFDKGKLVGAVGFFQDLRTLKQLEREKQASDRLAVVGQTVAGLAHGIKNILTGLEGGVFVVQTALDDEDDKLLHGGWKMVRGNIGRIAGLVKDLLSYSKERAPQYKETDPNRLAEEVCALFDLRAQANSIIIQRDFDSDAGKMFKIFLDQSGIHTCLSNLVANAVDACEIDKRSIEHRIVVGTEQNSDGSLIYKVSDNGPGMSLETKRHLFSSFYSTKGSRGTGLGLMVTNKIVLEHGGKLSVNSEESRGSVFTITLPLAESMQVNNGAPTSADQLPKMERDASAGVSLNHHDSL